MSILETLLGTESRDTYNRIGDLAGAAGGIYTGYMPLVMNELQREAGANPLWARTARANAESTINRGTARAREGALMQLSRRGILNSGATTQTMAGIESAGAESLERAQHDISGDVDARRRALLALMGQFSGSSLATAMGGLSEMGQAQGQETQGLWNSIGTALGMFIRGGRR